MENNPKDAVRNLPSWITAISLALLVLLVIYAVISGWAFRLWNNAERSNGSKASIEKIVLIVGSGTVYNYLQKMAPAICSLDDEYIHVSILEGATQTGINLLSDAYLHGRQEPEFPILAIASDRQDEDDFICTGEDRFFEVQIGNDILKVTFGAASANEYRNAFNSESNKLEDYVRAIRGSPSIRISDLALWVWRDCEKPWSAQPHYTLFITNKGSATRALFESHLNELTKTDCPCWPKDSKAFDLSFMRAMKSDLPWIALGSQLLYENRLQKLQKEGKAIQLSVLDENDMPINRGFYIYGRLSGRSTRHIIKPGQTPEEGYDIDPRIAYFFDRLFDAMEKAAGETDIDVDLLESQKKFLHLDKGSPLNAWISEQAGSAKPIHIYRRGRE